VGRSRTTSRGTKSFRQLLTYSLDVGYVSITDVSKVYGGNILAVDGGCLEIEDGEFLALVGPLGSGATDRIPGSRRSADESTGPPVPFVLSVPDAPSVPSLDPSSCVYATASPPIPIVASAATVSRRDNSITCRLRETTLKFSS
jgi:hypothetical protein